jgi:PAS domain S-box-containing protein
MKQPPTVNLRRRAERQLREHPATIKHNSRADTQRMLQELQIHQIELELQNEELKLTKAEVDAGLEKFTDLYDFAPVGYFTLTADGTIHQVNLTGTSMVGIDRSKLVGRRFGLLLAAGQRPAFNAFLTRVFVDETKQSQDFELLREGRTSLFVNIEANRMLNGVECHAVVVDITERKQAEIASLRLAAIVEFSDDAIIGKDLNSIITSWNKGAEKIFGYTSEEMVGTSILRLIPGERSNEENIILDKIKSGNSVQHFETQRLTKAGKLIHVSITVSPIKDSMGEIRGISKTVRDISERKKVEDILRRNEALFSALLSQAPIGLYLVDDQMRLIQVNPRALPVFKNVRPLLGRDFSEVIHLIWPKRVADQVAARFRHTLKTGEPYQSPEFVERRKDTQVKEAYEWQIQRVILPTGEHRVVCFFSDITERKRAEETQRRVEVLAASNAKLVQEIIHRQTVEAALTNSEQLAQELLKQSRQLQKKLREMSHQNLLALENQRKEISHELHDKISQVLIGINVRLAVFTRTAAINPRTIAPVRQLVEKSVKIVHDYARELRPAMLDQLGLIPAIRTYIDEIPKRKGRQIDFTASAGIEALDNDKRTVLYRVAQEALVNVAKHARAHVVQVTLKKVRGSVRLEITDDGKSFEVERLSSTQWSHRLGLTGMRERVEMAGGKFSVESIPGQAPRCAPRCPSAKAGRVCRCSLPAGAGSCPMPAFPPPNTHESDHCAAGGRPPDCPRGTALHVGRQHRFQDHRGSRERAPGRGHGRAPQP